MHPNQQEYNKRHKAKKRDIGKPGRKPKSSAPPRGHFVKPADDADPETWLLAYLPRAFPLPFGQVHRDIMREFVHALATGGNVAIAAPRGTGKSTLVNGLALWALLTGRTSFPVIVPWSDKSKRQALRFWSGELCFNARLEIGYPEAVRPFVACKGVAQRLASMHDHGEATGARLGLSEGVIVLPGEAGAIGSATINGNPRGMNYSTHGGDIRRPTLAIIDDPQDRKTAASPARVQETIERIDGDVAGMAGPDSRMSMVMCCTVIQPDDVSEHYLSDPDWRSVRVGQIATWPARWKDEPSDTRDLWEAWNSARLDGEGKHDGGAAALAFYGENCAAMIEGMTVTWSERYDRKRNQPDALYAAMYDFYSMGESAFMAERQNAPINEASMAPYRLTRESIAAHVTQRAPWEVPPNCHLITAGADINPSYGISWSIVAFQGDHTAHVLGYGVEPLRIPAEWSEAQKMGAVFTALANLRKRMDTLPCRPKVLAYDVRGWDRGHALAFWQQAERDHGLPVIPAQGMGWKAYRPNNKTRVGDAREQCHMAADEKGRRYLVVHADYWREVMQLAFACSPGAPGSCSLPAGDHGDFADQLLSEPLLDKKPGPLGMEWLFTRRPGRNDLSDAMVMAYAVAAYSGIGTGGQSAARAPSKSKVCIYRPSQRR